MGGLTIFVIILFLLIIASYAWLIILSIKLNNKADIPTEETPETFINY